MSLGRKWMRIVIQVGAQQINIGVTKLEHSPLASSFDGHIVRVLLLLTST
jgi:hypothetical protein